MAERPGRPLVVVFGSSRVALGLRPDVIDSDSGPVVFNFGMIGAGPELELLALSRLLHDGVRPAAVVVEVWPTFIHRDWPVEPKRLRADDWPLVHDSDPEWAYHQSLWRGDRWCEWSAHREYLISLAAPTWLPATARRDVGWDQLDGWGWRAGLLEPDEGWPMRVPHLAFAFHGPILRDFAVSPSARADLGTLLATCRGEGIPVALMRWPESTTFRGWYAERTRAEFGGMVRDLCGEFGCGWIDACDWVDDRWVPDEFHLSQQGAALFTRLFAERILPRLPARSEGGP
jgi:hypothetical protein